MQGRAELLSPESNCRHFCLVIYMPTIHCRIPLCGSTSVRAQVNESLFISGEPKEKLLLLPPSHCGWKSKAVTWLEISLPKPARIQVNLRNLTLQSLWILPQQSHQNYQHARNRHELISSLHPLVMESTYCNFNITAEVGCKQKNLMVGLRAHLSRTLGVHQQVSLQSSINVCSGSSPWKRVCD